MTSGFRDDIMVYDEYKRLMFYNRSPKSDLLNNGWRNELDKLLSTGDEFCSDFQLRYLVSLVYEPYCMIHTNHSKIVFK